MIKIDDNAVFDENNALLLNDEANFEYDLNGNLFRKTVGGEVVDYVYDVDNRLVRVVGVAEYGYDPFGRRIWKDVDGVLTYFAYSDEGLVGEFDANGVEIKGYGWKPDSTWSTNPLFLKVSGSYFWYQNDHLGTPQKIVDGQGNVVWEAVYSAFGKARVDTELVESNLRFAGQYFDFETGLHYNWWRFYDPGTGRYFRSDPIGLSGGINGYVYAYQNPINYFDPDGKLVVIIPAAIVAVIVAGAVGGTIWWGLNNQSIQRPQGMSRLEERHFDKRCNNSNDPCTDLKAAAKVAISQARIKMKNLLLDKGRLFGSTGWTNHIDDLQGRFANIAAMISLGKILGCDMTAEIILFSKLYIPSSPL